MPRRKPPDAPAPHEYGSGSCYQRRDGRWAVAFSVGGRRLPPKYFGSEREARAYQAMVQTRGPAREPSREPLQAYLVGWTANRVALRNLTPSSARSYELACRRWWDDKYGGLGKVPLGKLRPHHVESAVQRILKAGIGPRTTQLYLSILSSALKDAVRLELILFNPVERIMPPRALPQAPKVLWDASEVQHFLAVNRADRLIALWTLLLTVGSRDGETRALCWSDLDERRATLTFQRGLSQRADYERDTKTHRARTVPLVPELLEALREHRQRQRLEKMAAKKWDQHSTRIFCTTAGEALTHGQTRYAFEAAVARILGHSNPSITMRVYAHVLQTDVSAAMRAMQSLLRPKLSETEESDS
jgi:integrase